MKFVLKTSANVATTVEFVSLQVYMYLFAQVKPLQKLLFFLCSLYQYFTSKSVSQEQVDELTLYAINLVGKKQLKIRSLAP